MKILSISLNRILEEADKIFATSIFLFVDSVPVYKKNNHFLNTKKNNILTESKIHEILESFLSSEELERVNKNKELIIIKNFYKKGKFKVNIFLEKGFPSISFYKIDRKIRDFKELNFPVNFEEIINHKTGLFIVTGPNGSGRNSTVSSIINKVNNEQKKYIATLENPVEHIFKNKKSIIKQRQLIRDVSSYKQGAINYLEDDLDIVYFNENRRDFEEYLPYAIELASGSCLVILEMSAENSVRALENILNVLSRNKSMESSCHILADVLTAVVAQKIVYDKNNEPVLAIEFLLNNEVISSLIKKNSLYKIEKIMHNSTHSKMISMKRAMLKLLKDGVIEKEEFKRVV